MLDLTELDADPLALAEVHVADLREGGRGVGDSCRARAQNRAQDGAPAHTVYRPVGLTHVADGSLRFAVLALQHDG